MIILINSLIQGRRQTEIDEFDIEIIINKNIL